MRRIRPSSLRADAFGARVTIAMDLLNVLPATYDDPSAVVPPRPTVDHRPYEHVLTVSREAVSPDSRSGLASVPSLQALRAWHDAELAWLSSQ